MLNVFLTLPQRILSFLFQEIALNLLYSVMPTRDSLKEDFGPFIFSVNKINLIKALQQPVDGRSMVYKKHKLSIAKKKDR